jgi:hypothetical protein
MNFGPVLPDDNGTGEDLFSIISFDTEPLPGTIATVNGTAAALFMSHLKSPLLVFANARENDVIDGEPGILLAMAGFLSEMVLVLEFEDDYFLTFDKAPRGSHDFGAFDSRVANSGLFIIRNQQDFIQLYLITLSLSH